MCGRYFIADDKEEREIKKIIDEIEKQAQKSGTPVTMKTGEIFPSDVVPILTQDAPQAMRWGFTGFRGKGYLINARAETADQKPTFRSPYLHSRCLVPASWFFEWRTVDKKKEKYAIGRDRTLYMAGIYRPEKDLNVPAFTILTMDAAPSISFIHDRMPVIIPETYADQWLGQAPPVKELIDISVKDLKWRTTS